MLCTNCSKLALLYTKKSCIKCQGDVLNNISVLCETCSNVDKVCAVCLKKVQTYLVNKLKNGGCSACRNKNG